MPSIELLLDSRAEAINGGNGKQDGKGRRSNSINLIKVDQSAKIAISGFATGNNFTQSNYSAATINA
jgi:hypothetical protein